MGRLTFSSISPLFVDRFGRSLWFCHLEFDKEAISNDFMAHFHVFRGGVEFYSPNLRKLWIDLDVLYGFATFDNKSMNDGVIAHFRVGRWGGFIVKYLIELSFCGPCGPCLI